MLATLGLSWYITRHIAINTDVNQLLAADLPWRQQEKALEQAFPQQVDRLVVVIDAKTADVADQAAASLAARLAEQPELFKTVVRPEAIPFFRTHGLLFLSTDKISGILDQLVQAQPVLGAMAADPSLRGLFGTLGLVLQGLERGDITYDRLEQPLALMADSADAALAGSVKPLPWQSLLGGDTASRPEDTRKFILTQPVLDFGNLAPGEKARERVQALAAELGLTAAQGITVRLTGTVALNDEEFGSVAQGTADATLFSLLGVIVLLLLALRSVRIIIPVLVTLLVGLVLTTAFAVAAVGSLNLISVAFAVMFIGIAVDFGIQFSVRYRDQRFHQPDPALAMQDTARTIALPLSLAAAATTLGFAAFIPTDYRGVAELGLIAGMGMIIAFVLNITLLPALLTLFRPPAEPEKVGFRWLALLDHMLIRHRQPVLLATALLALGSLVAASQLRFDFDPLNLKDPNTESVRTLFDLMRDPNASPYTIEILAPTLDSAAAKAKDLSNLPEVRQVLTLHSFLPDDQEQKLALINDANFLLAPTLNPSEPRAAPSDAENVTAIQQTADALAKLGQAHPTAARLATVLRQLADQPDQAVRQRLHDALVAGMVSQLQTVRGLLAAEPVTLEGITDDLRRDWVTADGRARIEVYPKGDARDHKTLTQFTAAVRKVAPEASGAPISIQESGRTVTGAFIKAGLGALAAISLLMLLVLRDWRDVLRLLAPLILAGLLTLATMVLINLPLNFANIIALPLLLSLGVSYVIYFISYWRTGGIMPLQSSMARAVLFSAATTMLAFSSLLISAHTGTRSMGQLLTIALLYCVICSYIFLVALLSKQKT
jgi:hopanoid biosynthesis associated RND transporter like protein HpnN